MYKSILKVALTVALVGITQIANAAYTFTDLGMPYSSSGTNAINNSYANAINSAGQVVGYTEVTGIGSYAVLWDGTTSAVVGGLNSFGATYNYANAINNNGNCNGLV